MGDEEVAALAERRYARPVLRTGRKVGRTVYLLLEDGGDALVGLMDTPELAAAVAAAMNAAAELSEYFETELAVNAGNGEAEWALSLLRPIWALQEYWLSGGSDDDRRMPAT